ncbi:hypothetical protein [Paenibacillus andongensis]|nr:hypothetical protein [Paenibacillus andongensis]
MKPKEVDRCASRFTSFWFGYVTIPWPWNGALLHSSNMIYGG